jgi:signal transduction histidine kinase
VDRTLLASRLESLGCPYCPGAESQLDEELVAGDRATPTLRVRAVPRVRPCHQKDQREPIWAILPIALLLSAPFIAYLASPETRRRRELARLHLRVAEIERARVACELHDGAIQSLVALEMEVAAWLLTEQSLPPHVADRLRLLQRRLRKEIINLRELTHRLRPLSVNPSKIFIYLAELVSTFQRQTGIAARFVCGVPEITLTPQACYEAVRILQEALTNVRKHSGATTVLVRFDADKRYWSLVIEDNGTGFQFVGRRTHVERDRLETGPSVISERVRLLGGALTIESNPDQGARLEIRVPRRA